MTISMRFILGLWLLTIVTTCQAATTLVAVASNFTKPMTEIAAAFETATGHTANLSFGASGKFVAQLENGGPFEVFLSADQSSPKQLADDGFAISETQFTYAVGKLVLWSPTPDYVDKQGQILSKGGFKHLALADPKLAPYGAAAVETMKHMGVYDQLKPLYVFGENISQTQQFISTGNAELGFIAVSQVIDNGRIVSGSGWIVPENKYSPIRQDAILLKTGAKNPAAIALLAFLKSPGALAIIKKYGYN